MEIDLTFWDNVLKTDSCWMWTGKKDLDGYGLFYTNGKQYRAHRYSYEIHWSIIPKSYMVGHICDVPNCVNPEHLIFGTSKDNSKDMVDRGRSNRGKIIQRLNDSEKRKIKLLYETSKITTVELATQFGISRRTVTRIINNKKLNLLKSKDEVKQKILNLLEELSELIKDL